MKKYKAVFTDMDGTLLNSQHQISAETIKSIQSILNKQIPFIPVSARPPYAITPYTNQLGTNQAIICYSGALILDNQLNPLYSVEIEAEDFAKLEHYLAPFQHLSISYYAGLDWFTNNSENEFIKTEEKITALSVKPMPNNLSQVHKILIMGDAEPIQKLETELQKKFPHLSIHRSKAEYLEIMNKSATKSKAIQFMQKILHVEKEEIVAFGDNFNDLDMLEYVGLSVAMGNAPDEIKAVAKEVTLSNDQDGIALVLKRLFA